MGNYDYYPELLLTLFTQEVTIVCAILSDEILAILINITHYGLILLYHIRSLTELISDNRIKEFFFKVRISPIYEQAYMHFFFLPLELPKLNEIMHKICVLPQKITLPFSYVIKSSSSVHDI